MRKVLFLLMSVFIISCSTCIASYRVQINDKLGAATINSMYNDYLGEDGAFLKAKEIKLAGSTDKYDCYTASISAHNGIKYICNKAGYVDAIYVISRDAHVNKAEAFALMSIITNQCDADRSHLLVEKSTSEIKMWHWHCNEMNRTYGVNTMRHGEYISTVIYAWVN